VFGSPPQLLPFIQAMQKWATRRALHTPARGLPKDWKRRSGRPRQIWIRTKEADLQPFNYGLNSAWRLAGNRGRWRQLVETATLQSGDDDDDALP